MEFNIPIKCTVHHFSFDFTVLQIELVLMSLCGSKHVRIKAAFGLREFQRIFKGIRIPSFGYCSRSSGYCARVPNRSYGPYFRVLINEYFVLLSS